MDDIDRIVNLSREYRGIILDKCINLEGEITGYIAIYFSNDIESYHSLIEIVLDRLTFDSKIGIFQEVLKRKYPAEFEKKYDKLLSELRYIKDVRNRFAHLMVYTGYDETQKIPKEFGLINHRNGLEIKTFSKGDFELFNSRIEKCIDIVVGLILNP